MSSILHLLGELLGALVGLLVLLGALVWGIEFYHRFRFYVAYRRKYLLVCTAKRGWHDFLQNNVLPVLPANVEVVWANPQRDAKADRRLQFIRAAHAAGPTPLLVAVQRRQVRSVSLAGLLRPLRSHARRDVATQQEVARVLAQAIRAV